jgi:hypothetical protein
MSSTLPKRPIAVCVVSERLKGATVPFSIRTSSSVRTISRSAGGQYSGAAGTTITLP